MPVDEAERARRRALPRAHFDAENVNDLYAVMATIAPDAVMLYNTIGGTAPVEAGPSIFVRHRVKS